jgi:ribonucleoside-diphosphate reductase alpha chain
MRVIKRDGTHQTVDRYKIEEAVKRAANGLPNIDINLIVDQAYAQLYDDVNTSDIDRSTVLAARTQIINEPSYSYLAARLLLNSLYREAFGHKVDDNILSSDYRKAFVTNLKLLIHDGRLSSKLLDLFDI